MDSLLIVALLTLLAVADVSAIKCFQCNSYLDKGCEDIKVNDTSSKYYKDCEVNHENVGKDIFCRKTIQLILDADFEHTRIIRSCGWIKHPKYSCYFNTNKGHEDESCTCYHDGCNSATVTTASITFFLGIPLISVFLWSK